MDINPIPLILFSYNRPRLLEQLFSKLELQDIDHLIVFVDGPKNSAELAKVEACRRAAAQLSGVSKELYFHEHNHGLIGLLDNIQQVMESYYGAIFLEDDYHPIPRFYQFMKHALLHYQNETQVFSIGGYQPVPSSYFMNYPYALVSSNRFLCWGWGTWRNRWLELVQHLESFHTYYNHLKDVPEDAGSDLSLMARLVSNNHMDPSWDITVSLISLWLGKSHLIPSRGLVKNVGKGSGIHGGYTNLMRYWLFHNKNLLKHAWKEPNWPDNIQVDPDYAEALRKRIDQIQNTSLRQPGNLFKILFNFSFR